MFCPPTPYPPAFLFDSRPNSGHFIAFPFRSVGLAARRPGQSIFGNAPAAAYQGLQKDTSQVLSKIELKCSVAASQPPSLIFARPDFLLVHLAFFLVETFGASQFQ